VGRQQRGWRRTHDSLKPFAATSTAEFTFEPAGGHTVVTWSKAIHLVMDMDTMVGGNFEKGLADMKSVVEARRGA
jgi:carbon monoxide dehydrogenase subunit G